MPGSPGCIKGGNRNSLLPRKPQNNPQTTQHVLHTTGLLHNLSLPPRPADAPEPPPIMRSAKSPQNSDFRQVLGISGASETAARGSLVQCKEAICSPGGCCLLILPIARDPLSRLLHRGSFNCNPRMGRVKKPQRSIENPIPGWMDRWTASYRQTVLLTWAKLPRVGFSPWREGLTAPETGVRVGQAAVKLPARLEEEVMRQEEEGPLRASPPSTSDSFSAGRQLGPSRQRGGWDRECHPARFQQECGS